MFEQTQLVFVWSIKLFLFLILSALQTNTYTSANSVDPDEMAHEPSHLDLHCLPFTPFVTMEVSKLKDGTSETP